MSLLVRRRRNGRHLTQEGATPREESPPGSIPKIDELEEEFPEGKKELEHITIVRTWKKRES